MSDFYWEDEGGLYADMDYMDDDEYEEYEKERKLNDLRERRVYQQHGKYLIVATKNNKTIYLQDQRISNGGYWTQFNANARVFTDKNKAQSIVNGFKYNNPRVIKV